MSRSHSIYNRCYEKWFCM